MRRGPGIDRDRRIYEKTQRSVEDNIRTDDDTGAAVVHPGDDTLRRVHDTGQADISFQLHVWFSGRHHTDVSVECKAEQQLQADVDNVYWLFRWQALHFTYIPGYSRAPGSYPGGSGSWWRKRGRFCFQTGP